MAQTVRLKQRNCPSCAAPLPPTDPTATEVVCAYCRQRFEVVKAPPPRPKPKPKRRRQRPPSPKVPDTRSAERKAALPLMLMLPVFLVLPFVALGPALWGPIMSGLEGMGVQLPDGWAPPPPPPDLWIPAEGTAGHFWIDQYATPALADVTGDGALDLLAITGTGFGEQRQGWVGAYRGTDLSPLWRYGPLPARETRQIGLVVAGDQLVVLEPYGVVSILDLATGRQLHQLALEANQSYPRLCAMGSSGTHVLLPDRTLIDTAAGTARRNGPRWHQRPDDCTLRRDRGNSTEIADKFASKYGVRGSGPALPGPLKVTGHRVRYALIDGDDGLALLEVTRGEDARVLMGFDPKTSQERWRLPLTTLSPEGRPHLPLLDLGEGAVVVGLSPGQGSRMDLSALDAKTGDLRWTKELPGRAGEATFGDGAVWLAPRSRVVNGMVLRVDLMTGEHLTLGGR